MELPPRLRGGDKHCLVKQDEYNEKVALVYRRRLCILGLRVGDYYIKSNVYLVLLNVTIVAFVASLVVNFVMNFSVVAVLLPVALVVLFVFSLSPITTHDVQHYDSDSDSSFDVEWGPTPEEGGRAKGGGLTMDPVSASAQRHHEGESK